MENDLTGKKISFTYPKLVQYVSGSFYDGIGNLIPTTSLFAGNIDGGKPDSVYGGSTPIVAGGP